jgi:hypothetical protein
MNNQKIMIDTRLLRQLLRVGKAGGLVVKGVPGGFLAGGAVNPRALRPWI